MKYIIITITSIALIIVALKIGFYFGSMKERIMTGSPAYFVLYNTKERLKNEKVIDVINDLESLLLKMDPKNNSGINSRVMLDYLGKFNK
jgi:hypothetical protein